MNPHRLTNKQKWSLALVILLLAAFVVPSLTPRAEAGKEGVYISDSVYFSIDDVKLSPGDDLQTLRYTLELVNGSGSYVDYNKYGAAVLDGSGNRYSSEITAKINSRVKPGKTLKVSLVSKIPAGISLSELKVQIYAWNFASTSYIKPLGTLNAASVEEAQTSDKAQAVFNLADVDSSYSSDALAAFELNNSYKMLAEGTWNVYVQMNVENLGSSSYKIPSSLVYTLLDADGLAYTGSAVYGGDQSILPRQSHTLVLKFPVGDIGEVDKLILQFSKKQAAASGAQTTSTASAAASSTTASVLGTVPVTGSFKTANVEEEISLPGVSSNVKAVLEQVSYSKKSDGVNIEARFSLKNTGSTVVKTPVLSGIYQLQGSILSVAAEDALSHPAYLGAGESTEYKFKSVWPSGLDPALAQLTVTEEKEGTNAVQVPVYLASLPASTAVSSSTGADGKTVYYTTAGKLAMSLNKTYRLMTEGGDDLLISEVQIENQESHVVALPALVAGYSDGAVELPGKVIRIQTSAYLSAGQKTMLYLVANAPIGSKLAEGKVYFGEGTLDSKTNELSISKEWANFQVKEGSNFSNTELNQDWYLSAAGRQSIGRIIDQQVYELDGEKILAVRIASKNQETRTTSPIPYAGYFLDGESRVWAASETLDTSRGGKDSWSLSTLWAKLPSGNLELNSLVFGHKLEAPAFGSPLQYLITTPVGKPADFNLKEKTKFQSDLAPYHLYFSDISRNMLNSSYKFSFKYEMLRDFELTSGSQNNRSLYITIEDDTKKIYGTYEYPLEGTGSLVSGETAELSIDKMTVSDLLSLYVHAKIRFYEKFEGGLRLLGTVTATSW